MNIEHESSGDTNKNLLVKEYLDKITPYLRDDNLSSKIWYMENLLNNCN